MILQRDTYCKLFGTTCLRDRERERMTPCSVAAVAKNVTYTMYTNYDDSEGKREKACDEKAT